VATNWVYSSLGDKPDKTGGPDARTGDWRPLERVPLQTAGWEQRRGRFTNHAERKGAASLMCLIVLPTQPTAGGQ
jgi:hypothetical protein